MVSVAIVGTDSGSCDRAIAFSSPLSVFNSNSFNAVSLLIEIENELLSNNWEKGNI